MKTLKVYQVGPENYSRSCSTVTGTATAPKDRVRYVSRKDRNRGSVQSYKMDMDEVGRLNNEGNARYWLQAERDRQRHVIIMTDRDRHMVEAPLKVYGLCDAPIEVMGYIDAEVCIGSRAAMGC